MQRTMLYITTKLKRIKVLRIALGIISLPVRLPLLIIYKLGEWSEHLLNILEHGYSKLEYYIVDKFNWNNIAQEQYKNNPDKFK
jgi:hypothetical protein